MPPSQEVPLWQNVTNLEVRGYLKNPVKYEPNHKDLSNLTVDELDKSFRLTFLKYEKRRIFRHLHWKKFHLELAENRKDQFKCTDERLSQTLAAQEEEYTFHHNKIGVQFAALDRMIEETAQEVYKDKDEAKAESDKESQWSLEHLADIMHRGSVLYGEHIDTHIPKNA